MLRAVALRPSAPIICTKRISRSRMPMQGGMMEAMRNISKGQSATAAATSTMVSAGRGKGDAEPAPSIGRKFSQASALLAEEDGDEEAYHQYHNDEQSDLLHRRHPPHRYRPSFERFNGVGSRRFEDPCHHPTSYPSSSNASARVPRPHRYVNKDPATAATKTFTGINGASRQTEQQMLLNGGHAEMKVTAQQEHFSLVNTIEDMFLSKSFHDALSTKAAIREEAREILDELRDIDADEEDKPFVSRPGRQPRHHHRQQQQQHPFSLSEYERIIPAPLTEEEEKDGYQPHQQPIPAGPPSNILSSSMHEPIRTSYERLRQREKVMEEGTLDTAMEEYKEIREALFQTGKGSNLPVVKKVMFEWYEPLIGAMEKLQVRMKAGEWQDLGKGVGTYGPCLLLLPPEKLAVITLHETMNAVIKEWNGGVHLTRLLMQIGEAVRTEVNFLKLTQKYGDNVVKTLKENGVLSVKRINKKAKDALEDGVWRPELKVGAASLLLHELIGIAKVPKFTAAKDGEEEEEEEEGLREEQGMEMDDEELGREESEEKLGPAFRLELKKTHGKYKRRGVVTLDETTFQRLSSEDEDELRRYAMPRYKPMLIPPKDWTRFDDGGYLELKTCVVRGDQSQELVKRLRRARMGEVFEALNFLGKVKWRINTEVYEVIQAAWEQGLTVGDLPSKEDLAMPPLSEGGDGQDAWKERARMEKRVKKHNAELYSLRCDTSIKLDIAKEFLEDEFYFPYNLDFRGRSYPVPPNLNHLGSDLCRGMLLFAERKELGKEGLSWLKIHLANLCGKDKFSFEGRKEYVDSMMEEVRDSAERPLEGRGWWRRAEEPWQALAMCKEIIAAIDSGCPEYYESGVPVHMDGSCNGLQHYAALGRDEEGARQVNLIKSDQPQDVYTGVCDLVVKHIHQETTKTLPKDASKEEVAAHEHAKLVDGLINRKVVKQTVMTSVYGVTFIGARKQIQARLKEKFQERKGGAMLTKDEEQSIYEASRYVTTITLSKLAELFSAARNIMEWLAACSSLVATKAKEPMAWVTPLGLPVIQPYRRETGMQIKTLIQNVILVDCNDKLPVSSARQRSAFPPNFVHSLDSTHMLMTANKLKQLAIPFTAVHDSYWCHASNVEIMNSTLRDCFVELYHQPILEGLRNSLVARYPNINFPPIPQRGTLRLEEVKESPYFFD